MDYAELVKSGRRARATRGWYDQSIGILKGKEISLVRTVGFSRHTPFLNEFR